MQPIQWGKNRSISSKWTSGTRHNKRLDEKKNMTKGKITKERINFSLYHLTDKLEVKEWHTSD